MLTGLRVLARVPAANGIEIMQYIGKHEQLGSTEIRFVHRWIPEGSQPWASISIVHGLGDHGGRFDRVARWLVRHGMMVTAIDLVGHGRSFGKRGCIDSYEGLVEEVSRLATMTRDRWPDLPRFLMGQSMGGNLVLNAALRCHPDVSGVIACAPMLRASRQVSERFLRIGRKLSQWLPHFRMRTPVDAGLLSRDFRAQQAYMDDRFVHRHISLRLAMSLVDSGHWALHHAEHLAIPTLLVHGAEDALTCPLASREFAEANPEFVELRIWQGLRHDLHHEPEWQMVIDDIRRWLAGRVSLMDHRRAA